MVIASEVTERKQSQQIQAVLFNISQAVNTTGNLQELLEIIHHQLGTLIDTANFYVALYDKENGLYSFPYCVDEYDEPEEFTPQQLKNSLTDYVRRSGKPLLVDEHVHRKLMENGEIELGGQFDSSLISA